jgi:UDP-N-acetylglucosamine 1-carboxyvinyltransferase
MVLAGIIAKGNTIVNNIEYILRGYENLDKKLNKIGAKIKLKTRDIPQSMRSTRD